MSIEVALGEHEEQVDGLIKAGKKYVSALNSWKKACQAGHIGNRQKWASSAEELVKFLEEPTSEVAASWNFDVKAYLEGDEWRSELRATCKDEFGFRVFEEEDTIVAPPVIVRSQPGQSRLLLSKVAWPTIHPKVTAKHLKGLNEKSASQAASQQFLNSLYDGSKNLSRQGNDFTRFCDLYKLFSYAPGWAKENTKASFSQQIYSLHRSDVQITRDSKSYEFEYASGTPKDSEVFSIISDDGRPIRYYGIWFKLPS